MMLLTALPPPHAHPGRYVVWTISFSYGTLRGTDHITVPQPGVCFAGFVDPEALQQLAGEPALNATHYGRWELVVLDAAMLSTTIARSAHMLRMLSPRLFPTASSTLYTDIKLAPPADPLAVLRALERAPAPIMLGTLRHPGGRHHDVYNELLNILAHLRKRRFKVRGRGAKGRRARVRGPQIPQP